MISPYTSFHLLLLLATLRKIDSLTALTDSTIQQAVNDWCDGGSAKSDVQSTYGDINDWDVSQVTDMSSLF